MPYRHSAYETMAHAFVLDIFLRVLGTVGTLLLGIILYFAIPAALAFFFRRITGIEQDYETLIRKRSHELVYINTTYWRTNFFMMVYILVRLTIVVTTVMVAFWIWHYDLWYVILGIGVYGLVILIQMGDAMRHYRAHVTMVATGMIKKGQHVDIAGTYGIVIDLTSTHVVVCDPELLVPPGGASTVGQPSQGLLANTLRHQGQGVAHAVPAATRKGIHFIPNGNVMSYVVTTTDAHHLYPYVDLGHDHTQ